MGLLRASAWSCCTWLGWECRGELRLVQGGGWGAAAQRASVAKGLLSGTMLARDWTWHGRVDVVAEGRIHGTRESRPKSAWASGSKFELVSWCEIAGEAGPPPSREASRERVAAMAGSGAENRVVFTEPQMRGPWMTMWLPTD